MWDRDGKLGVYPVAIQVEAHLDGKVRLIPQYTSETVGRKLPCRVQTILDEVSAELVVQGSLHAHVM